MSRSRLKTTLALYSEQKNYEWTIRVASSPPRRGRSPPRRSPIGRRRTRSPVRRPLRSRSRSRSVSPRRSFVSLLESCDSAWVKWVDYHLQGVGDLHPILDHPVLGRVPGRFPEVVVQEGLGEEEVVATAALVAAALLLLNRKTFLGYIMGFGLCYLEIGSISSTFQSAHSGYYPNKASVMGKFRKDLLMYSKSVSSMNIGVQSSVVRMMDQGGGRALAGIRALNTPWCLEGKDQSAFPSCQ
ncbi:hypothetical protein BVC80_4671g1 [Macleaya cordata]|uniref:Uncharacterized protein n=1 Tax=Macleaya cordata TaxID=56857 RepID=A0A200R945_MACCD|nr:hypothetical protein BVC80_4671g1 [Macleaya cordata]